MFNRDRARDVVYAQLGGAARSVALALLDATSREGEAETSGALLAARLRIGRRNVQIHLRELREAGFLVGPPTIRGRGAALYRWDRERMAAALEPLSELEVRQMARDAAKFSARPAGEGPDRLFSGDTEAPAAAVHQADEDPSLLVASGRIDPDTVWRWILRSYTWARSHAAHYGRAMERARIFDPGPVARETLIGLALDLARELCPMVPPIDGVQKVMRAAFFEWIARHRSPVLVSLRHPLGKAAEDADALRSYAYDRLEREAAREARKQREREALPAVMPSDEMVDAFAGFGAIVEAVERRAGGMR